MPPPAHSCQHLLRVGLAAALAVVNIPPASNPVQLAFNTNGYRKAYLPKSNTLNIWSTAGKCQGLYFKIPMNAGEIRQQDCCICTASNTCSHRLSAGQLYGAAALLQMPSALPLLLS